MNPTSTFLGSSSADLQQGMHANYFQSAPVGLAGRYLDPRRRANETAQPSA